MIKSEEKCTAMFDGKECSRPKQNYRHENHVYCGSEHEPLPGCHPFVVNPRCTAEFNGVVCDKLKEHLFHTTCAYEDYFCQFYRCHAFQHEPDLMSLYPEPCIEYIENRFVCGKNVDHYLHSDDARKTNQRWWHNYVTPEKSEPKKFYVTDAMIDASNKALNQYICGFSEIVITLGTNHGRSLGTDCLKEMLGAAFEEMNRE